jgi:CPA2 family monovalent cation:H+ antiporter-2
VARASVVAVTFDQRPAVERILHIAQQQNATIARIVSAADDRELAGIVSAGASTVFPENFAAGLGLAHQVLRLAGLDQQEASNAITQVRTVLSPELSERVGI